MATAQGPYGRLFHNRNFLGAVGISRSPALTLALFASIALAETLTSVPFAALLQARVPDAYIGRVSSFLGAVEGAAAPLSALAGGWVADRTSPATVVVACGVWVVLTAALVVFNPQIRDVRVAGAEG